MCNAYELIPGRNPDSIWWRDWNDAPAEIPPRAQKTAKTREREREITILNRDWQRS
jgi:hypothetical protein